MCALIAGGGGGLYIATWEPEPVYQHKRLSEWLRLYEKTWAEQQGDSDKTLQAAKAVRQIGADALPQLIAWMRYDSPSLFKKLSALGRKLPGVFHANAPIDALVPDPTVRHQLAKTGFRLLGPASSPALSEFLITLTNLSAPFRQNASDAISNLGPNAGPAIPALLACLQETNEAIAVAAAEALGRLRLERDVGLSSPLSKVRLSAGEALSSFGPEARAALPALLPLLNAPAPDIRGAVEGAILAIDPDAMPEARRKEIEAAITAFRKRYGLGKQANKSQPSNHQ